MNNKKIAGIISTSIGIAGAITGSILLPISCLKEYKIDKQVTDNITTETSIGIGSSNYLTWEFKISGTNITPQMNDYIKLINDESKNKSDNIRKEFKYSDFVKESREILDNWETFERFIIDSEIFSDMYGMFNPIGINENDMKELFNDIISNDSLMIAGEVLLPIFTVVMIIGILFIILGIKRKD